MMDTFDLSSISENDQIAAEMTRRAGVIAKFYTSMVEGGLPTDLAGTITVEWARASLQPVGTPPCGCDCDVCRSTDPRDRRTRPSILILVGRASRR